LILGLLQCFVARQHADHLSVGTDHAHARYADLVVTAILLVLGANTASPEWGWRTVRCARRGWRYGFLTHSGRDTTVSPGSPTTGGPRSPRPACCPGPRPRGSGPRRRRPLSRGRRPPAGRARAAGCVRGSCSRPSRFAGRIPP